MLFRSSVGGDTLAGVIRCLQQGSSVAACGLAGGAGLNTTVLPFILRGVNLLGINSVTVTLQERLAIWQRLALDLPLAKLDRMTQVHPLSEVFVLGESILGGGVRGRVVFDMAA